MNINTCALKWSCRKAERTWRKTKQEVNHSILKETIATYNKIVRTEKQIYFSKIITKNSGNSRVLFSTIFSKQASAWRCEEFATFFKETYIKCFISISHTNLREIVAQTSSCPCTYLEISSKMYMTACLPLS